MKCQKNSPLYHMLAIFLHFHFFTCKPTVTCISRHITVNVLKFQKPFHIVLAQILLFMQLIANTLTGMAVKTLIRSSLTLVCTVCMCCFVSNFSVKIFRTFTVMSLSKQKMDLYDISNSLDPD